MAAPWQASSLTHSHKRDAHRCAHQCRRRLPDHAERRARSTVAVITGSSHRCYFGHLGAAVRFLLHFGTWQLTRPHWARQPQLTFLLERLARMRQAPNFHCPSGMARCSQPGDQAEDVDARTASSCSSLVARRTVQCPPSSCCAFKRSYVPTMPTKPE